MEVLEVWRPSPRWERARGGHGQEQPLDTVKDEIVRVALRLRTGAVLGPLVEVAVGEPGDADYRASVQLARIALGTSASRSKAVRLRPPGLDGPSRATASGRACFRRRCGW